MPGLPGPEGALCPAPVTPGLASALLTWPPPRRPLSLCSKGHCSQTCRRGASGRGSGRQPRWGSQPTFSIQRGGTAAPGHTASQRRRSASGRRDSCPAPTACRDPHTRARCAPTHRNTTLRHEPGGQRSTQERVLGSHPWLCHLLAAASWQSPPRWPQFLCPMNRASY